MSYRIAGIDVHKRMLTIVVSDVEVVGEFAFERRQFGSGPAQLRELAGWLVAQRVEEVVMESTAQYWKPVWASLERDWKPLAQQWAGAGRMAGTLHLAQAQSNRARPGRKRDFTDAERLVKRFVAHELTLSFVPDPAQRLWRTLTRTKYQTDTESRPTPESAGGVARRGPHQVVQSRVGPPGRERAADATRARRGCHRPGGAGSPGKRSLACDPGAAARCARRLSGPQSCLSTTRADGARRLAAPGATDWSSRPGIGRPAGPVPRPGAAAGGGARVGR